MLIHSLIHSLIEYAVLIWGHAPSADEIFCLQEKAIRILFELNLSCRLQIKVRPQNSNTTFNLRTTLFNENEIWS